MGGKIVPLASLSPGMVASIIEVEGGYGIQRKLHIMGIMPGKKVRLVSVQPMRGPVTIETNGRQISLGRGMAARILVEVIE